MLGIVSPRGSIPRYNRHCRAVWASVGVGGELIEESLEDSESYGKDGDPNVGQPLLWCDFDGDRGGTGDVLALDGGLIGDKSLRTVELKGVEW